MTIVTMLDGILPDRLLPHLAQKTLTRRTHFNVFYLMVVITVGPQNTLSTVSLHIPNFTKCNFLKYFVRDNHTSSILHCLMTIF